MRKIIVLFSAFASVASYAAKDPISVADVVGRSIDAPYFGHIGIWTGSNVLEVLANPGIIYENSLISFKNQTYDKNPQKVKEYWGARAAKLTSIQQQAVIAAGRYQKNFNPQYTTSFFYTEGGYVQSCIQYNRYGQCAQIKQTIRPAVFRCDTFVQYSFSKGASYTTWGAFPVNVFNSFPIVR